MMVMKMMVIAKDEECIVEIFESSELVGGLGFILFLHSPNPFCENCVIYESPAIRTYFYISNIPAGGILALLSGRKTALFLDPFWENTHNLIISCIFRLITNQSQISG